MIIDALKMYRKQHTEYSSIYPRTNFSIEEESMSPTQTKSRSIHRDPAEAAERIDSLKYISTKKDSVSNQQTSIYQAYHTAPHLPGKAEINEALHYPKADQNYSQSTIYELSNFQTSMFQDSALMASAREEPQHRVHNKIAEELICALCGEMYNDPRLLPCLHSFCRRCLEHTVNPRSATITCHSCRKEISLLVSLIL